MGEKEWVSERGREGGMEWVSERGMEGWRDGGREGEREGGDWDLHPVEPRGIACPRVWGLGFRVWSLGFGVEG